MTKGVNVKGKRFKEKGSRYKENEKNYYKESASG